MSTRTDIISYGNPALTLQPGWTLSDSISQPVTLNCVYQGSKEYFITPDEYTGVLPDVKKSISAFHIESIRGAYNLTLESWAHTYEEQLIIVSASYKGVTNESDDDSVEKETYEWVAGVGESPIQLHPDFERFAGKPGTPKNGAIFLDAHTHEVVKGANPKGEGYFSRFGYDGRTKSKFAGVQSFLNFNGARWKVNQQRRSKPSNAGIGKRFSGSSVEGRPATPSGYSWLKVGVSYRQVGTSYEATIEYMLGEWDSDIYRSIT